MAKKNDKKGWWLFSLCTCLPTQLSLYILISLCICLSIHSSLYFKKVMAKKDGKERWQERIMTSLPTHLSPYAFVSLYTWLFIVHAVGRYFRLWKLSVFRPLVKEWGYRFSSITRWCRVWAVGWTQLNMLLSCADIKLVIGIGQGYWLDSKGTPSEYHWLNNKGASSECHWLDDKGLTPANHCYARVVTRWLEVLANYAR